MTANTDPAMIAMGRFRTGNDICLKCQTAHPPTMDCNLPALRTILTKDSYRLKRDIIIPAGTILRQASDQRGGRGYVEATIGHGRDFSSALVVQVHPDAEASGDFEKVI